MSFKELSPCMAFIGMCLTVFAACAADAEVSFSTSTAQTHSTVLRIHGKIEASSRDGKTSRALAEGSQVFVGETVRASTDGEAVLRTQDAGMIAVRPGTEFVVEQYAATGQRTDHQTIRLLKGALRTITGWIGHIDKSRDRLVTPTATIGIRGTDHEPYVLHEQAPGSTPYKPGTYDKVNRGATTLDTAGNSLDIDAGQVGFAPSRQTKRQRALMTLLLPTLLDRIPEFYVPGRFEHEVDAYSVNADKESQRLLEVTRRAPNDGTDHACPAQKIANAWVGQLDAALDRRDAVAILGFFAPEITASATVRTNTGKEETVEFSREELVESTLRSVNSLQNYRHRRISIEASALDIKNPTPCKRLKLKSVVIEEGLLSGKPFRFESREEFELKRQGEAWLAIEMHTTQL